MTEDVSGLMFLLIHHKNTFLINWGETELVSPESARKSMSAFDARGIYVIYWKDNRFRSHSFGFIL